MTHRCHIAATLVTQDDTIFSLLHLPMQCEFMEDVRLSEFRKSKPIARLANKCCLFRNSRQVQRTEHGICGLPFSRTKSMR